MNIKTVVLTKKKTSEKIYLSNWDKTTTNIKTSAQIKQTRKEFNEFLKELSTDYFIFVCRSFKTGDYININTGKLEKLYGL